VQGRQDCVFGLEGKVSFTYKQFKEKKMKKKALLVLAFAFLIAGGVYAGGIIDRFTGGGGGNSALNGTWVHSQSGSKLVQNNGKFTLSLDDVEEMRGSYTATASEITLTSYQLRGSIFGSAGSGFGFSPTQWYTEAQMREKIIQYFVSLGLPRSQAEQTYDQQMASTIPLRTGTYTLSGNTLTMKTGDQTSVYTRLK